MKKRQQARKATTNNLPKIINRFQEIKRDAADFPLDHISYSAITKFSTNPLMFKINYMNRDYIQNAQNISGVIGKAYHLAMQTYYQLLKEGKDASEAIAQGLKDGTTYLEDYDDHFIKYSPTVIATKQKAIETFAFAYTSYIKDKKHEQVEIIGTEIEILTDVSIEWRGQKLILPIPLKGYIDKLVRNKAGKGKGKLSPVDYKTTRSFSDPEKIDGAKIIQAIQYYFMVYAEYGETPYSMIYEEVKWSKNSGKNAGEPQLKEYEIIYEEHDAFFDFYFRFYDDVIRAISGEAVFVPNINDFYDNELGLLAYIYRLDVPEEQAKLMKKFQVDNITDLLKRQIQHSGNMRKLLKQAEQEFETANSINYENMKIEERIATKLMEHGMLLKFDSKVDGNAVDLYRYTPSIGLKMSKLKSYVADIEQVVGATGVRVLAPIPNTTLIGFEVPRKVRTFVELSDYPKREGFEISMGVDIMGKVYTFDFRKAPHILVAGATGSGKSIFLNSVIDQISKISGVDLHLFDPKLVELSQFKSIAKQYYTETEDVYLALDDLVDEMNRRYKKLSDAGARNIEEYNKREGAGMNYKVIVIDEFGDLVMSGSIVEETVRTNEKYKSGERKGEYKTKVEKIDYSKAISKNVLILAQKARACGMHLIIATQRPSVDIITGSIKANFPTKVAFRTAKEIDSRVLLDEPGAEKLLGKGDMIFSSDSDQVRLQGFNY